MSKKPTRYQQMQRYMCIALLADCLLFYLFWISAASGTVWAKVLTGILITLLSLLCLVFLFLTKELLRRRSLWMTALAASVLICMLFSHLLRFPCPKPQITEHFRTSISETEP